MPLQSEQTIFSLLGISVFAGLLIWAAFNSTGLWRSFAALYPRPDALPAVRSKLLESIIIAKRPGPTLGQKIVAPYRLYVGVMLSVADSGLLLSRVFPFNFLCPPVYLPFESMTISPTYWALWPEPEAIRMQLLPDTDIILGQKAAQWLRKHKT